MSTTLETLAAQPQVTGVTISENNGQWTLALYTRTTFTSTGDPSNPLQNIRQTTFFGATAGSVIAQAQASIN